jgi:hypothetical protein
LRNTLPPLASNDLLGRVSHASTNSVATRFQNPKSREPDYFLRVSVNFANDDDFPDLSRLSIVHDHVSFARS